jgi:hypothetical protein
LVKEGKPISKPQKEKEKMRRVIYIPDVEESIPDISYHYLLPVSGKYVI